MAQADSVADLVQQGQLAIALLHRQSIVGQGTVDPDIALDLREACRTGRAAGQIGEGRRAVLPGTVVAQQDGRVVGVFAARVLDALECDVADIGPGREGEDARGDLGGVELRKAGGVGRHRRDRVTEGIGHGRRCAQRRGPALVRPGDLGTGVGGAERRLAVRAEDPAVVRVQIEDRTAVRVAGRTVEAGTTGADLVAGDGTEGGILSGINRFADPCEPPGLTERSLVGLKKLDGVAVAAIAVQAEKHGTTVEDERSGKETLARRAKTTSATQSGWDEYPRPRLTFVA